LKGRPEQLVKVSSASPIWIILKTRYAMGKYDSHSITPMREHGGKLHPIWRGVGFAFVVLIPVLSYYLSEYLIQQNNTQHWMAVPSDLLVKQGDFLIFMHDPMIQIRIIVTVFIMFVLFSAFSFLTFLINSMFGGSRYGPFDMPPVRKPRGVKTRAR
jgi:hypothetical protein